MSSVFTKIIAGDLPGHFVWKDDVCVGFLSINPIAPGHTLIIPRLEVDHWLDLPHDINSLLVKVAQVIGRGQMGAFNPLRIGMIIAGLEVPHTHLHIIPMNSMEDLDFTNAATTEDHSVLAFNAEKIKIALESNGIATGT